MSIPQTGNFQEPNAIGNCCAYLERHRSSNDMPDMLIREELEKAVNFNVIPIQNGKTLYAIGRAESGNLCSLVKFDSDKLTESTLLGYVEASSASKTVLLKGVLYVVGGLGGERFSKRVSTYNITTGEKGLVADLQVGRVWGHSVAASSDEIFVCGGREGKCEAFYPGRSRTWKFLPDLRQGRSALVVVFLPDGRLLATGGWSSVGQQLASCELLNIESQSEGWLPVAAMKEPRCSHGAVYFQGNVFVAGGFYLTSCEVFVPPPLGSTTKVGQWTRILSEMTRTFGFNRSTVVVSANEILVFGGVFKGTDGFNGVVERFMGYPNSCSEVGDFEAWTWTPLPQIGHLGGSLAIGVHCAN